MQNLGEFERFAVARGPGLARFQRSAFGLTHRDHLLGVRPGQFAPTGKSAAFSDFREILAHIFFGFFHLGSKRQVERLPWNLIDSFNYVS